MPKKKAEDNAPKVEDNAPKEEDDAEEDSAVVKRLKEIDLKYCEIEKELDQAINKLEKQFKKDNAGLIDERLKILNDAADVKDEDKKFATPACKGFWLKALQNTEWAQEFLEEHDEPVLEYLEDIKSSDIDEEHARKGTKVDFFFKDNEFFTNKVLTITLFYDYDPEKWQPWMPLRSREIQCTKIDWKPGKDVTVELVQKKVKGGGAKKAKQKAKQAKEEPRQSFFRVPFCNLKKGEPLPKDITCCIDGFPEGEDIDDEDMDQMTQEILEQCEGVIEDIDEKITKYAVRYYTGEAVESDSDSDGEGGESESGDEDEEDDDDESDEEPAARPKGKAGKAGAGKAKPKAEADAKKQEECKQQ